MRAKGQGGRRSARSLLLEGFFSSGFGPELDLPLFLVGFKRGKAPGCWGWERGTVARLSRGGWLLHAEPYPKARDKKELPFGLVGKFKWFLLWKHVAHPPPHR